MGDDAVDTLRTGAIVLHAGGAAIDDDLRHRLAERGWRAVGFDDPHLAMAELCQRNRAATAARSWTSRDDAGEHPVLVLADGRAHDDLVRAVHRHVPGAAVWRAIGDDLVPHSSETDVTPVEMTVPLPAEEAVLGAEPAPARRSPLTEARLDDDDDDDPRPVEVTADELAMLFGRGDAEPEP